MVWQTLRGNLVEHLCEASVLLRNEVVEGLSWDLCSMLLGQLLGMGETGTDIDGLVLVVFRVVGVVGGVEKDITGLKRAVFDIRDGACKLEAAHHPVDRDWDVPFDGGVVVIVGVELNSGDKTRRAGGCVQVDNELWK